MHLRYTNHSLFMFSPLDIPHCSKQLHSLIHSATEQLLGNEISVNHAGCLSVLSQAVQSYCLLVAREKHLPETLGYKFILTLVR